MKSGIITKTGTGNITVTILPEDEKNERNGQIRPTPEHGPDSYKLQRSGHRSAILRFASPAAIPDSARTLPSLAGTTLMYAPCVVEGLEDVEVEEDGLELTNGQFCGYTNGVH